MAARTFTLGYERPLAPGTVRITRGVDSVTIRIAPDTGKRAVLALLRPLIVGAVVAVVPLLMLSSGAVPRAAGAAILILIAGVTALGAVRIVHRSGEPIVFHADARGLHVVNPLDFPARQSHEADDIVGLQLRRISLVSEPVCFHLELVVRRAFVNDFNFCSLLVSQSFETLDRIGRTLLRPLGLKELEVGVQGWASGRAGPGPGAV